MDIFASTTDIDDGRILPVEHWLDDGMTMDIS